MKISVTDRALKALPRPTAGSRIYYDESVRGFGARITSTGAIAFVLNYTLGGREYRYTIANFPEKSSNWAREEALRLRGEIRDGRNPLEAKRQARRDAANEPTVTDLANDYIDRHALPHKRPSSVRNDRQMIKNLVAPHLGALRVSAVTRRDVEKLHASLKATPYMANRVLSLLSKMFTLAREWGWRADVPTKGVPRFPENKREAWLTIDQLTTMRAALDSYADQRAADALRLLLLTGARKSEVLSSEWVHFDLDRGIWTKPAHSTKQKTTEHVPLNDAAIALLRRLQKTSSGRYVFPGRAAKPDPAAEKPVPEQPARGRVTVMRPWLQVCKAAGFVEAYTVQGKRKVLTRYRPTLRIHDLRHNFASALVSSGTSLYTVGKLLGHTQPQTTARYAHLADPALREAANSFAGLYERSGGRRPRRRSDRAAGGHKEQAPRPKASR